MNRRIRAIIQKEFIHIIRDWRSLLIILLMPILMIVLYGYAITLDMTDIRFTVVDDAKSPESRALIEQFSKNGFFILVSPDARRSDIEGLFMRREAQMAVVIDKDFSKDLNHGGRATFQLLIDAGDSNVATFIRNYSEQVLNKFNAGLNDAMPAAFTIEPRIFYNADLNSTNFFVPGLVALILMLISALLTSIAITREKETGTMEQILVSPVHPVEIVVGKVFPYLFLGLLNGALILLFAEFLFHVPFRGSLALLGLFSLIFVFVALSFGLLFSTIARTQLVAMFMTLMATILPTIMLSGFIFPIASMPALLQVVSKIIPATYYLIIIRGIMLKGVGVAELWQHGLPLLGMGMFLVLIAVKRFKTTLD